MKKNRIISVLLLSVAFISVSGLLCFFHNKALYAGNVTPLANSPEREGGVKSLLNEPGRGDINPLLIEDPDTKKVIAEGLATIYNGNAERARAAALRSAYSEAVERVTGIHIGSLMLVRNVKQASEVVMSRSRGFIRSYKIIKEGISEKDPGKYEVLIEADVVMKGTAKGAEGEGLRLYLELLGNPKLLIILPEAAYYDDETESGSSESSEEITVQSRDTKVKIKKREKERHGEENSSSKTTVKEEHGSIMRSAEAAVAQAFSSHGYQVITSDDLLSQGLIDPEVLKQAKAGVTAQAIKVAKAAGADIALLGVIRVSTESVKPAGVSLVMVVAEASAKALIVSSGRMVQAFHQTERASSPQRLKAYSDTLDRVADNIADVLAWKIPHILTEDSRESRLIIHGIDMDMANKIKTGLLKLAGVESVRFGRLPETKDSTAEFIILTGFVLMAPEEISDVCEKNAKKAFTLLRINKYEIELRVRDTEGITTPERRKKGGEEISL